MEFFRRLVSLTAEDGIDIGIIERFFKELPEKAWNLGTRILLSAIVLFIGIQLIKIIRKIVKKSLKKANVDKGVMQFTDSFLKAALYVLLLITIASGFGLDAASILALLGSAGVAIGLAIQGSLSNLIGGVLILLLNPFKVGDYIKEDANGNEGEVATIDLFYTRLKTPDNKIIVLPNGTLANSSLTNVTACENRRLDVLVGVSYDTDVRQAKAVLQQLLETEDAVLKEKEHFIYVDALAESAVMLGLRCWVAKEAYWEAKWRITENVKYALDEAGIKIPYPQLEIHMEKKQSVE